MPREIISLGCTTCQRRNYSTTKNRRTHPDRLELKKYQFPGDEIPVVRGSALGAMEKELRFAIREGGRTVGAGVVAEVLE